MLENIVGLQVQEIYVYKSIFCLSLGECIDSKEGVYQFDLEIQSPFRIIQGDRIVFGLHEMLGIKEYEEIGAIALPTRIVKIAIGDLGDFRIEFDGGVVLEVFIDTREKSENWRLSDNSKGLDEDIVFNQKEDFFAQKAQEYKTIEKFLIRNAY